MIVREMLNEWRRAFPEDELFVWCHRSDAETVRASVDPSEIVSLKTPNHGLANLFEVPFRLRNMKLDGILAQNFAPLRSAATVLILDVLFQSNPEWFTPAERAYLALIPMSAKQAATVLTISENELARIQRFNPHLASVRSVGLSISSALMSAEPVRPSAVPAGSDFWLSVGRLNVRKNLTRTLEASAGSLAVTKSTPLYVVGEPNGRSELLPKVVREAVQDERIVFLGGVSDPELVWLYKNTRGLIYMSLDEGFGLPPVEAAHFGCPVIVSDRPVFRETMSNYPLYADPLSISSIRDSIDYLDSRQEVSPAFLGSGWSDVVRRMREAVLL
ncbi:glycosyltransferase family 4 protein [Nocardioides dongkuii]|uniref:glycosyltransferase family 4 protein n=1 Tax=Nocardioides dongkuii TaxID=2760089 RepID=UPI0018780CFA|nr:glycosyltransferase family 1 protein [Nocardioides dongkuii]